MRWTWMALCAAALPAACSAPPPQTGSTAAASTVAFDAGGGTAPSGGSNPGWLDPVGTPVSELPAAPSSTPARDRRSLLERSYQYPQVEVIVEGTVAAASSEIVQAAPAAVRFSGDGAGRMIATRYTVDVTRSWKAPIGAVVEVFSYGGMLAAKDPSYPHRVEMITSEIYPDVGDTVILPLARSHVVADATAWHPLNGNLGGIATNKEPTVASDMRDFLNASFASYQPSN